jgi:hypothetical protein
MSDISAILLVEEAASEPAHERGLSPLLKGLVIVSLSLAAWVPVALPLFLLFHR